MIRERIHLAGLFSSGQLVKLLQRRLYQATKSIHGRLYEGAVQALFVRISNIDCPFAGASFFCYHSKRGILISICEKFFFCAFHEFFCHTCCSFRQVTTSSIKTFGFKPAVLI